MLWGETENPVNSGASDPTKSETTPEGGNGSEETPGEKEDEGQIPAEDQSGDNTGDPAEEPAEEVVDPTTDPEAPVESEEPTDIEGGSTVDSAEVNAPGDSCTVTIENYQTLRDQIDISATVNSQPVKIPVNGQITATEGESGGMPPIGVELRDTANWKIQEVTKDGEKVAGSSPYTISGLTADTTIAVTVAAVYSVSLVTTGSETIIVKDKTSGAETPADTTVDKNTAKTIKKGDPAQSMEFTVTGYDYAATGTRLKVYYSTDESTDPDDREELTAVMTEEGEAKTKVYTYTVPADVIASLESSIKIVLVKEEAKSYKTQIDALGTGDIDSTVKYQKTENNTTTWAADGKSSAFVGETLNFQIALTDAAKAVKEIKGVKLSVDDGEAEAITCAADTTTAGAYNCSFAVTEEIAGASSLTFTGDIAYKEANRATLTYELGHNVDADSVTAVAVKSVTYGTTTTSEAEALKTLLGVESLDLKSEKGPETIIIPKKNDGKDLAGVVVEATIKGGYKVDAATGIEFAAQTATYTFATGKLALSDALKATSRRR